MSMKPHQTIPAHRAAGVVAAHLPLPEGDDVPVLQPEAAARGGTLRRWIDQLRGPFRQPTAWAHTTWSETEWAATTVLPRDERTGSSPAAKPAR